MVTIGKITNKNLVIMITDFFAIGYLKVKCHLKIIFILNTITPNVEQNLLSNAMTNFGGKCF